MSTTNGATNGAINGKPAAPGLWVTGIASQFPPYSLDPEHLEKFASRFYDVKTPGLKNLLEVSRKTTIEKRPSAISYDNGFGCQAELPDMTAIDAFFRQAGVDLAARACRKAMRESGCTAADITHTVAVTATNHGCPGYDVLVASKLGLSPTVDSTLLQGVGCSGGLSLMRAAANAAGAATMRGQPARVLAYTCEICTAMLRYDLAAAEGSTDMSALSPAATMLSDGAGAFVLCNDQGLCPIGLGADGVRGLSKGRLQLLNWKNMVVPNTHADVGFFADPNGM
ncbi:hypothetical protein N8I77_002557 [Diaporthe amygdali]|uniref:Chalcone/stilbene synthase N-terminal domain-containing protein n=1 Tax=Phomopsis amygdali TaxID=1214568 RepID=A0AAD9SSZ2_PHOAM|nr:hypothetical protein N8I77_002557 [Diaporthe amygdali]